MKKIFLLFVLLLVITTSDVVFKPAFATVSSCTATVSPSSVLTGSDTNFIFTIQNTDTVSYNWVQILRPNSNWITYDGSATGWTADLGNDETFTGSTLAASASENFTVVSIAPNTVTSSQNWTVNVSDNGGSSYYSCTGSLGTAITLAPQPPSISNIVLSSIGPTSLTISWDTDKSSTSVVYYGLTSSYGLTKSDSTLTTSHSLNIDSLSANTNYYYYIESVDSSGTAGSTGQFSFLTAIAGVVTTTTVTVTNTVKITPTPSPTPVPDTTKPVVTVFTDFSKPFDVSPQILGKASDNKDVAKIEYSLDGGRNFLAVDTISSLGKKSTNFSFIPQVLDDGNYDLRVRALDSSGNIGFSKKYTLIIDRLPPQVTGVLFSLGPQILSPNSNGSILVSAGKSFKITLSDVGGATSIDVFALTSLKASGGQADSYKFKLLKNPDNGLWSTNISLEKEGEYVLRFEAVDGANNKTERILNKVNVVRKGQINAPNAKITVYFFDNNTKDWKVWDGSSYGQKNPINSDSDGNYSLFLPSGKYYLQVESYGYQTQTSEFFKVDKPEPINADFYLNSSNLLLDLKFVKLYWPDFTALSVSFVNNLSKDVLDDNSFVGKKLPFFTLPGGFSTDSLNGRPSVLTFLNTWSPSSSEQISVLNDFSKNKNFNSVTIIEGEKSSRVFVFKQRGGYSLNIYADSDAIGVDLYNLNTLPTHYFIDRKGVVTKVIFGVLSKQEIEDILSN